MLFACLYRSLFAMVDRELTENEAESTVKAIKDGLNAVLESSTEFCAPFIGSLHVSNNYYDCISFCQLFACIHLVIIVYCNTCLFHQLFIY